MRDLAWVGFWGTLVSFPVGLALIPAFREEKTWVPIAALTLASYATKHYLLHGAPPALSNGR